ncbi:FMN-dependent NADH-azoreductase [Actinobacillus pleuropneumoniae]|nr:FMN-dependent NADH-azoreductase [Actinobacillus pleuropneumoniae]
MSNVLFIKANNRAIEQSVSVKMYHEFLESFKASHPEDQITELDLFAENLPYYDGTAINGMFKAGKGLEATPEEQAAAANVSKYLEQFLAADKIVLAFPLWNMTVPAVLHTYIDYLNQAGKTFNIHRKGGRSRDRQKSRHPECSRRQLFRRSYGCSRDGCQLRDGQSSSMGRAGYRNPHHRRPQPVP